MDNPVQQALHAAMTHRFGASVAGAAAAFALGDRALLHTLLEEAGFQDVTVEPEIRTAHVARAEDVMAVGPRGVAAVVPQLATLDEASFIEQVRAVQRDVEGTLGHYADGPGLNFPMAANVAVARV